MPGTAASAPHGPDPGLRLLNTLSREELHARLALCLDVDRWVEALADEAPYSDRTALLASADAHARTVTAEEAASALARHPRIGERPKGGDTEARWSRGEQAAFAAGTDDAAARVQRVFSHAQREYEDRFGHIYLVCASGRSSREFLGDLVTRLSNDTTTELGVVADELRRIAGLRLVELLDDA